MGIGIDDFAFVYLRETLVARVKQFLRSGVRGHQRGRCFSDAAAQDDFGLGTVLEPGGPAAIK